MCVIRDRYVASMKRDLIDTPVSMDTTGDEFEIARHSATNGAGPVVAVVVATRARGRWWRW
jgi:hypothetical protein